VDGGHPAIDTFLFWPNSYLAKILEKGCPTWPDNRGCTVYGKVGAFACYWKLLGIPSVAHMPQVADPWFTLRMNQELPGIMYSPLFCCIR